MKIKSTEEILGNHFFAFSKMEIHLAIRDNPDVDKILLAMEEYADQFRPKETNWRGSFDIYLEELNKVYNELLNDVEWIKKQQKYNPGLDIKLSLEKAYANFWSQESGWQFKKRKKSKDLNWKSTLTKAISMSINKVWPPKDKQQSQVIYNKPKFLE